MRKLFAFLVRLFSFWTWHDLFVRWLRSPTSHPASGETAEPLPSHEVQQDSEFARFLSSLPEDGRGVWRFYFCGDWKVKIFFGRSSFTILHGTGVGPRYREFLEAVASSEIEFEEVSIYQYGDDCCQHVEAFADALRQSDSTFRILRVYCQYGSAVRFAKCVSSVLLGNDAIQHLHLHLGSGALKEEMDKEGAAEFMAFIDVPHVFPILKTFSMYAGACNLDGEGMEQLLKPFRGPHGALEELKFWGLSSNAELEQIGGMLASNTSLKRLEVLGGPIEVENTFTRGYTSIATALCTNQSLEALWCQIHSSTELKMLLDPLIPKNNSLQCNTTLTKLTLWNSIGREEGTETLVDMIHTNTSLLDLGLIQVDYLLLDDIQATENVLAILEALKTNKSLRIGFFRYKAVGGYKVLGAMMDLLLENHNIEDIDLADTRLSKSGDADYVLSALSKRKKMKLWGIIQSMAIVNPTFGRVFLCGAPFAGKTRLQMSMKQLKEFQRNNEISKEQ